ncbi:hypothetical protein [Thermocatellispora tengchongensis]|uniref:hypothetical protein n=1 Tax=Thermocatellispora tengchongensis TaxID=1073253 RepID=UPI0033887384
MRRLLRRGLVDKNLWERGGPWLRVLVRTVAIAQVPLVTAAHVIGMLSSRDAGAVWITAPCWLVIGAPMCSQV